MNIPLNSILNLTEEQIKGSKIELNLFDGGTHEAFIDRWLERPESERAAGRAKRCSYWAWYGKNRRNFHVGDWVFSFMRLYRQDEWLFVSAAEIIEMPERGAENGYATVRILDQYAPLFGRLIINLHRGNKFSLYVFNLDSYLNEATVKEILPALYSGDTFGGYDRVHLPYAKLDRIFRREIMPSYYDALESVTGVYCLTDTRTGKLYIGSATGEGGVAARWGNYLDSKHGGNKKLRELYDREGEEYFRENFEFTLLEYFGMSYDPQKVLEREQWWKDCLDTRAHGYNDN